MDTFRLEHVGTNEMVADGLTKALNAFKHVSIRQTSEPLRWP